MENYDEHTEASGEQQNELEEGQSQNKGNQNDQQSFPANGSVSRRDQLENEDLNDTSAENSEQNNGLSHGDVSPWGVASSATEEDESSDEATDTGATAPHTSEENDQEDLEDDTTESEDEHDQDERESSLS